MKEKKYINSLLLRTIFSIIIFLILFLLLNNDSLYKKVSSIVFDNSIDFTYIRSKTTKILGRITNKEHFVVSEKLEYKSVERVKNSYKFITDNNYVINSLSNGVVTFIGDIKDLGTSVIIRSDDGFDYTFSNIENINVKMYDYIEKNTIIGSTLGNYFYLTISKDNEYYNYEDFI